MILAILQARMSSTRLPGKVLRLVLGKPLLALQLERIARSKKIDGLVVATSDRSDDDVVADLAQRERVAVHRGALDDVLDRFYQAAQPHHPEHVVRLTGDCPLIDPQIIDAVVDFHLRGGYDYTSNSLQPTFPDGLDVEVFRFACLEQAWREAHLPSQREHVTPFIHKQPGRYNIGVYRNDTDQSHLRWTVDEPEDLDLVTKIFEALYPHLPAFSTADVLALLRQRPELATLNAHHTRNAGSVTSARRDAQFALSRNEQTR